MALDPTARESNFKDSIIKYFRDNVHSSDRPVMFDKGLSIPILQGQPVQTEKWVVVNFRNLKMDDLSDGYIQVVLATRRDNEGKKLSQLRDTVMGYLTDTTKTDGFARISFYRSYADRAWELLGAMVVQEVVESEQFEGDDNTKNKVLDVRLRWGAKV